MIDKILCIAPQCPLPCIDGGKIGIFYPLKYLAQKLNVFFTTPVLNINEDIINEFNMYNIKYYPFELNTNDDYFKYPSSLLKPLSFKFNKYFSPLYLKYIEKIIIENQINILWINAPHMAIYALNLKKKYPYLKIYLREHNIEYDLVLQYARSQKNIFMKMFSYIEYYKTKRYEVSLWNKFDKVFFISDTDLAEAKKYNKDINETNLIYDGMEIPEIPNNIIEEQNSFIFTGNLKSFQNENNLKYFIKNIWIPFRQLEPNAKLYLTGNTDDCLISKLKISKKVLSENNIINLGFVEDIKITILSKQYVVSPTLYGSGIRLKVLEALSLKKVVFVSDIDYNMIKYFRDMLNIVHYSNYEDFYNKYLKLKNDKILFDKIKKNGYNLSLKIFNWDNYIEKVESQLY